MMLGDLENSQRKISWLPIYKASKNNSNEHCTVEKSNYGIVLIAVFKD
jgi:hypothetical protein